MKQAWGKIIKGRNTRNTRLDKHPLWRGPLTEIPTNLDKFIMVIFKLYEFPVWSFERNKTGNIRIKYHYVEFPYWLHIFLIKKLDNTSVNEKDFIQI